jgi:protein TonB
MKEALAKPIPAPTQEAAAAPKPPAVAAPEPQSTAHPEAPAHATESVSANSVVNAGALEQLRYVPPEYPASARAAGTSGWVALEFDVETDGSVANITVLGSEPKDVFDKAAVAAAHKWRYRPAVRDGHPIEQRAQMRIRFTLR